METRIQATTLAQRNALAKALGIMVPSFRVGAFRDPYLVQILGSVEGQAAIDAMVDVFGGNPIDFDPTPADDDEADAASKGA